MQRFRDFLKRKDIEISLRRYGIDALGAMAQGLFCSLLIGTILNTLGQQFHIGFLNAIIFTPGKGDAAVGYTIGGCASLMVGAAMAVAIGACTPMVWRVAETAPPPKPTSTPAAPVRIRCRAAV